jgi:hypothetical protein
VPEAAGSVPPFRKIKANVYVSVPAPKVPPFGVPDGSRTRAHAAAAWRGRLACPDAWMAASTA